MSVYTIYHNPRCSKSRQTLQLLEQANVEINVVEYLKNPPSEETIKNLLKMLDLSPRQAMRTKEVEYKEQNLSDESVSDARLIRAMHNTPKLIERPIVVVDDKACIGRPPENVLALL
ncbi:arsenate reductase (glutaredoxin) [Thalassotalea aquiviva]|uniref:arsenate reductase (glutaredoxin) n=1 Tax=Thalassotalea aquiviva TaxID=3242415 RepID=UPI00352BC189